ncbi:unnamed protein product [Urochloa humidicola]
MDQVTKLLQLIGNLKAAGLTVVGVAANFVLWRTQPAKERVVPAYDYASEVDITREAPERVIKDAAIARRSKFFVPRTPLVTTGQPTPFSLGNSRLEDRRAFISLTPLPEQPQSVDPPRTRENRQQGRKQKCRRNGSVACTVNFSDSFVFHTLTPGASS